MTDPYPRLTRSMRNEAMEPPNPKLQAPKKLQISIFKTQNLCHAKFFERNPIQSHSFGTRAKASSRQKWNSSRFAKVWGAHAPRVLRSAPRRTALLPQTTCATNTKAIRSVPSYQVK